MSDNREVDRFRLANHPARITIYLPFPSMTFGTLFVSTVWYRPATSVQSRI